jgi:hypothetical protein
VVSYPSGVSGPLKVDSFSKNAVTVGKITLSELSGGGTIAVIAAGAKEARYTWLRFNAAAGSAVSIRVHATIHPEDLSADDDIPMLRGVEPVLVQGGAAAIYRWLQQHQKAVFEESIYQSLRDDYVTRGQLLSPAPSGTGTMHHYRESWS